MRYTITREGTETIEWPNGPIDAERWHRRSDDGKTDAYIWLAPSLRYIPVKMRVSNTERGTIEVLLDSIRVDEDAAAVGRDERSCRCRDAGPIADRAAEPPDVRRCRAMPPKALARRRRPTAGGSSDSDAPARMTIRARASSPRSPRRSTRVRRFAAPADSGLSAFFRAHRELGARDRAFIADGVFAFLRRMRSLEALAEIDRSAQARARRRWCASSGARCATSRPRSRAADDVWVRAFKSRMHNALPPAVAHDLPDWLWDRLGAAYGDADALARSRTRGSRPRRSTCASNPLKTTRDEALAALAARRPRRERDAVFAARHPRAPDGPSLAQHPWLADGRLEVQDEGSQLVGYLVAPKRNDMVVDFCAGAGGKTLLLGALMRSQGRLYAFDVSETRLAKLDAAARALGPVQRASAGARQRARHQGEAARRQDRPRAGRRAVHGLRHAAPQSGSQVAAARSRRWPSSRAKQASILAAAATLVKPGGRLVYATCSVLPEENERDRRGIPRRASAVRAWATPRAELARAGIALDTGPTLKLLPHLHGCDGFFAAVLERARK